MDPDISIIFQASKHLLKQIHCNVSLEPDFNRRSLPSQLEEEINNVWIKRQSKNTTLYNGTKFRVHAAFPSFDQKGVNLQLGITCYKDFLGTNWSSGSQHLQTIGLALYGNAQACMSDPLGVGSLILTADQRIILLERSHNCAEAPGLWDIPGGHAEPQELVGPVMMEKIDVKSLSPGAVVKELYDSVLREIRDEVNIAKDMLSEPELMGITGNLMSASRPSLEFFIRCSLSSSEVLQLYHQGNQSEADESTSIQFLCVKDVLKLQENNKQFWNMLAPSAKGCFTIFTNMVLNNVLTLDSNSNTCNNSTRPELLGEGDSRLNQLQYSTLFY